MDILSQSEIDTLLNALSKGEVNIEDLSETAEQVNYKNYDFRRPNKFSKEQLRNLQALHGVFARILSNYLTGYLRANIQLEVVSVDQITYEDFINSIPIPTVLTVFSLEPLKGTAIMQFDPMFLFPMLDLFFGGKGDAPHTFRDFTDIELTVARNLSEKILENLSIAWRDIVQVDAQVLSLETNPRLHQIFSFNEIVALITLNVQIGDSTKGMLNLCLPYPLLVPLVSQLTYHKSIVSKDREINVQQNKRLKHWLGFPMVDLTVIAGQTQITVRDFLQLQEGDVLLLENRLDQDMDVYVGDLLKFKAQPGTHGNHLAVQISALAQEGGQDE
ncbi:MAG: flagellar motor switch protein FliM [Pelotomaculum sp.]|jgi:flagellar motor switch protein FliM